MKKEGRGEKIEVVYLRRRDEKGQEGENLVYSWAREAR